jgi:hypothetical protein
MRIPALLLVLASACASSAAWAQNCPPSDPLCENTKREAPAPMGTPVAAPAPTPPAKRKAAEDDKPAPTGRGVITLAEVTITGRIQKPIASVDVSRIAPKLTLGELRQPFLDRIEAAIFKDPF